MTDTSFRTSKMADLEALLPGFAQVWKQIKAETNTKQRCPKSISFGTDPRAMMLDDAYSGRRFALDLATMKLSGGRHVSGGEWAVHAGSNNDRAIGEVPVNQAVLDCEWNDFYRSFSVRVQVNPASMPKKLPEAV